MSDTDSNPPTDQDGRTGQVAETGRLDPAEADTPISDDQSVTGSPSGESSQTERRDEASNTKAGSYRD